MDQINYIATFFHQIKLLMTDNQALRSTILQQTDTMGTKQRFGLFSQPISTAIGDDGPYKTKLHPRAENGKPITQLRNFYTNPTKNGMIDYFEPLKSLATSQVKDIFMEQGKRLLKQQNEIFAQGRREANFVPASGSKTIAVAPYKYIEQNNPELNPKRHRAQDGRVISQPRNLFTNPLSKVETQFFKQPKHMSDPYDRKHQVEVQLLKKGKALEAEAPFKPNSFLPKCFSNDKKMYALDVQINKKLLKQPKFNVFPHQAAFRLSSPMKSGHQGFLTSFPKYIENPPKQIKRSEKKTNEKQKFRSMSSMSSKPTPSVTMMSMKRSAHNSFRR